MTSVNDENDSRSGMSLRHNSGLKQPNIEKRLPLRNKNNGEKVLNNKEKDSKMALRQKRRQTLFEFGKENKINFNFTALNPFSNKAGVIPEENQAAENGEGSKRKNSRNNQNINGRRLNPLGNDFISKIPELYRRNVINVRARMSLQVPNPLFESLEQDAGNADYTRCVDDIINGFPKGARLSLSQVRTFSANEAEKEYQREIYKFLKEIENKYKANYSELFKEGKGSNNYVSKNARNNAIRVLLKYSFKQELSSCSLELAMNIFDRVIEKGLIKPNMINKYLTACLFIAMKYEETDYIDIDSCLNAFSYCNKQTIFELETEILNALNFEVTVAYVNQFIDRIALLDNNYKTDVYFGSLFYLDLCYCNYETLTIRFSLLAASLYYYSKSIFNSEKQTDFWPKFLQFETGYTEKDLKKVHSKIGKILRENYSEKLSEVVFEKYKGSKYNNISDKLASKLKIKE